LTQLHSCPPKLIEASLHPAKSSANLSIEFGCLKDHVAAIVVPNCRAGPEDIPSNRCFLDARTFTLGTGYTVRPYSGSSIMAIKGVLWFGGLGVANEQK
jgi:hypothetical protein